MAEKYLDQSGVSRLLQGVNTFVNNAYKNVFTKMIEVDSYATVNLQPNQIIKITPVVDGPMTINFIAHTKPNAEHELIADVTPNATITYNGNILWENGEFVPNNVNTVRLKFTTFDSGSVYLAEYTLYTPDDRILYYSTTNDSEVSLTGLAYTPAIIPETQIGDEIYTRALLLKGSNVTLGTQFKNNRVLKSIVLPKAVTTISNIAFSGCSNLTSVVIPDGVTEIGEMAFSDCTSLTSATIGNSVTTIGNYAFDGCSSLTSITIPNSVTTIGNKVFADCDGLNEFKGKFAADNGRCLIKDNTIIAYAKASGTTYTIPDSVTEIGYGAFYNCRNLTSVTIPDSVTEIGEQAFYICTGLTSITIPNHVTKIRSRAFASCIGLTSVTIGNNVTTIGEYSFQTCKDLTSVTIPDSVTTIVSYAFYNCRSLTSITIPDGVTSIGFNTFCQCTALQDVYCKAITPPSGNIDMFSNNASDRKIYVPSTSVDAYKAASYWSTYADAIVGYDFENNTVVE